MSKPPQKAIDNGHDLEWDPPGLSAAERWTCKNPDCLRTALRFRGNEYGDALEAECGLNPIIARSRERDKQEAEFLSRAEARRHAWIEEDRKADTEYGRAYDPFHRGPR